MTNSMHAGFFAINVKPEHKEEFIEASIIEAKGVINGEEGVFQFQILVDKSNPCRFYFFEVFRDEKAIKTHWETQVFKEWWNTVEPMFEGEVEALCTMETVFPSVRGLEAQRPGLSNW